MNGGVPPGVGLSGKCTHWFEQTGSAEFRVFPAPKFRERGGWEKKQLIFDISKGLFLFISVTEVYVTGETTKQA